MKIITTILFCWLSLSALAQSLDRIQINAPYLAYGDYRYQNNYRGMRNLMADLPEYNPDLYKKLEPEWDAMQQRHCTGVTILTVGTTAGTAFLLSFLLYEPEDPYISNQQVVNPDDDPPVGRAVTGLVLLSAAYAISFPMLGNRRGNQLRFFNTFNRLAEEEKLRFSIFTPVGPGLKLSYQLTAR